MKRPASVAELVAAAHGRTRRARGLEAALLALAAALAGASAVELSGGDALSAGAVALEALCAVLCAATWWHDHRRTARDIAERADERLDERGALLAAFEREGEADPLPRLLADRVLASLPSDAASRAAHRTSAVFAAAPLAAMALFFAVRGVERGIPGDASKLVQSAARAVARAAGAGAQPGDAPDSLVAAAQALDESLARSARPEEAREALRKAQIELGSRLAPSGHFGLDEPELSAAFDAVEAALARLDELAPAPSRIARGVSGSANSASPLQNGAAQSTLKGSTREPRMPSSTSPAPRDPANPAASEVGTVAGRWWPSEYDDVIAAWAGAQGRPR